jgi:hypothetical protein
MAWAASIALRLPLKAWGAITMRGVPDDPSKMDIGPDMGGLVGRVCSSDEDKDTGLRRSTQPAPETGSG